MTSIFPRYDGPIGLSSVEARERLIQIKRRRSVAPICPEFVATPAIVVAATQHSSAYLIDIKENAAPLL
jgi:hypothetical protein